MDIPAAVIFLVLLFAIGPWLGVAALIGACIQLMVAWSTERKTMPLLTEATKGEQPRSREVQKVHEGLAPPPGDEYLILGHESFGVVESVGPKVSEFCRIC